MAAVTPVPNANRCPRRESSISCYARVTVVGLRGGIRPARSSCRNWRLPGDKRPVPAVLRQMSWGRAVVLGRLRASSLSSRRAGLLVATSVSAVRLPLSWATAG